jgi:hypothetical protein
MASSGMVGKGNQTMKQPLEGWRRVIIAVIVVAWIVFGYVGYRILLHFGIL